MIQAKDGSLRTDAGPMHARPFRLVTLGKFYAPRSGGIEMITRAIAEEAVRAGGRSVVCCFDTTREGEEFIDGVLVRRFRARLLGPAPVSLRFLLALRAWTSECDVLLMHYPNPLAELGRLLLGRKPFRTIVFYHSDLAGFHPLIDRLYWAFSRLVLRRVDRIVTTSPAYAGGSPVLRSMQDRVSVIPLATDPETFSPDGARVNLDLPFVRRVLFVGRFARFKGLDVLLDALGHLPAEYGIILIGDGPARRDLVQRAARPDLDGRVHFAGDIPNEKLPPWYRACDVFVLPSTLRSESFGVVALEAMASELPIVTTRLGTGTTLYNQDGVTGKVVPPGDPRALADAIVECYRLKDDLGRAARTVVEQKFTMERFRRDIRELLEI